MGLARADRASGERCLEEPGLGDSPAPRRDDAVLTGYGEVGLTTVHNLCTISDLAFLPRALALYRSLEEGGSDFRLWTFCTDSASRRLLEQLELAHVVVVGSDELEAADPLLAEVRPTRTAAEYCWTAKPAACLYALQQPDVDALSYVDSDVMFFDDPGPLLDELGTRSILILPHRFPPGWVEAGTRGLFDASFITFRRDTNAAAALDWWRERCLEWCFDRVEPGKYSDQKYLDRWPEQFGGVRAVEHPGAGLAHWNVREHQPELRGGRVFVDGLPLLFFHYSSLRIYRDLTALGRLGLLSNAYHFTARPVPLVWNIHPAFAISERERELLWEPYLRRIGEAIETLRRIDPDFTAGLLQAGPLEVASEALRRLLPRPIRRVLTPVRRALEESDGRLR